MHVVFVCIKKPEAQVRQDTSVVQVAQGLTQAVQIAGSTDVLG